MEIEIKEKKREQILFKENNDQEIIIRVKAGGVFVATWIDFLSLERSIRIILEGQGAQAEIFGITALDGDISTKIKVTIEHLAPETKSSFVWQNILTDASRTEIVSRVIVTPKAQLSEAKQLIKSLLLSDSVKAIVKPQLEIHADDVLCTHGATIGSLNEEEIRFLTSRGLSREESLDFLYLAFIRPSLAVLELKERKKVELLFKKRIKNFFAMTKKLN